MGKSILDAAVEYESATKQSLLDAANNFPVKKKESAPLYDQNFDLRSGVPLSQNGGINGQKTLLSKSQSPLLSDTNPINQVLNNDITQSNKKVFDNAKSFLDNDIQVQTNLQLKNVSAPQDKFSLQNIPSQQNNTIQSVNPQVKSDAAKAAIFNNPEALKDYRKKRQSEIDSQISQLEKEAAPYEQGDVLSDPSVKFGISSGILNDPKKQEEINSLKEYRSQFDKSIQDAAKISIPQKYIKNNIPIDLKQIGQEYFQVTGDNQINDDINVLQNIGNQYKTGASIKTPDGIIIPGKTNQKDIDVTKQNIQYRLYQQGANVMADYFSTASDNMFDAAKPKLETLSALIKNQDKAKDQNEKDLYQRQINSFLEDESVKNYLDATRQALDYTTKSKDAINQFPQVKRQQLRQQVNDVFMDMVWNKKEDNKIPFATGVNALTKLYESLVGSTPDKEQVQNIAKRLGLSEKEIQDIADEKNEGLFGVTPSGIRASGLLQGLAKGTDEQLAKSLMGVRRFFDTDNAETKNRLLQDKLNVYNTEGQKNKIKDDFNKWNINPYSIFNTMGRGVGQTAVFAVPSLVTGGLAGEGTIGEKLLEAATTIGSGYAGSYEDAYKEAAKYTDKEDLRRSYANITAYENALPELLLSPADIAKKVSGLKKVGSKQAFETFAKEATEKGVQDATRERMGAALKEFANVIGAENIEEQVTNVANNITKEQMFGVKMSPTDWVNQAIETAVQTTITTLPLGIGAGINGTNDISGVRKEGLFEAGNEPDLYKQKLQDLFDKGDLTQDQLNERTQVVNTMQQIVANVNKATKPNGKPLNYDEKKDLAAQQFRIQSNEKLSENGNLLTAQENQIKEDNKEALDIQNKILFGTKEIEEKPEDKKQPVPEKKEEIKIPEPPKVKGEPEDISKPIELSTEITIQNETEVKKAEVLPEQTNEGTTSSNEPIPSKEKVTANAETNKGGEGTKQIEDRFQKPLISGNRTISELQKENGGKLEFIDLGDGLVAWKIPKDENTTIQQYYIADVNGKSNSVHQLVQNAKGEFSRLNEPNIKDDAKAFGENYENKLSRLNEAKKRLSEQPQSLPISETKPIEDIQGTEIIKKGIKETNNYENFRKSTGVSDAEIKLVPLDEIEKYVFVNRKENPKAEDYAINGLAESIKEKGWREPIQFSYDDKHGVVIEGNTRVQAAKELGLKEIPVWFHKVKKATPNENGELIPLIEFTKKELPKSEQPSQNINSPINTEQDALQEQSAGSVLQHPQEGVGETGGERERMEPSQQGNETTGTRTEEKEQIAEKSISEKGKELADKIRQLRVRKGSQAYATIFGLPIAIYDTALVTIANAVELTADLSQAINEGVNYIKSKVKDWEDDGGHFAKHIEDFIEGKKPKLKVQVEAEKNEIEPTDEEAEKQKTKEAKKEIDNYDLTSSNETNKFLSGETWEDVFGEKPEGNQNYVVQKLTDMLQDGKNMIAVAQQKWGTDIMEYGKKLFSYIQNMERVSSNAETNKKAVLLATFLGEIKEAIINEPDRANEIRKLEAAVLDYYQHYMNVKGKQVVAGRLLRLYRDKYLGDVFASRILEDQQVKEKEAIQSAEKNVKVDDDIAQKTNAPVTEEENKKEEKAEKKRKEDSDKKQASKKSMSTKEAQQKANDKLKEIEQKLGKEKDKGLIAKINDLINKLNCP